MVVFTIILAGIGGSVLENAVFLRLLDFFFLRVTYIIVLFIGHGLKREESA